MAHAILADMSMSITELKKDPMSVITEGDGGPVAVLNRNQPVFYAVPAALYELMIEQLENAELNAIADARQGDKGVPVTLNDL